MSGKDDISNPEGPPSYNELRPNEMIQPTILVLAGQSIHAGSANSEPLYKMNRGISSLTHATKKVEFERVQHTVKTRSNDTPIIKTRDRQIYILRHEQTSPGGLEPLPSDSPHYFIEAVSSTTRTIGNYGLKKSRFRNHWKALPVDISGRNSKSGLPQFVKNGKSLFEIDFNKNRYAWVDGGGEAVAFEDEQDDQHRLIVTVCLPRQTMDVLVALWCCRMWQYSADHTERIHEGMEGLRRKFNLAKGLPGRGTGTGFMR